MNKDLLWFLPIAIPILTLYSAGWIVIVSNLYEYGWERGNDISNLWIVCYIMILIIVCTIGIIKICTG